MNSKKRVLVIGDIMLDHYIYGNSHRLSPEAPVPVVNFDREEFMLGGCGNLLRNLDAFQVETTLITVVGSDDSAYSISKELSMLKFSKLVLMRSDNRRTTVKQRIISRQQQIVRVDTESDHELSIQEETDLLFFLKQEVSDCQLVVISDYAKGVITESSSRLIIQICNDLGVEVFVDPKKRDFSCYANSTLVKPNLLEAESSIGKSLSTIDDFRSAANFLKATYGIGTVLITLGAKGVYCASKEEGFFPGFKVNISDVSGAGDTFLAAFVYCYIRGWSTEEAVRFANCAASIVVQRFGSVVTSVDEVLKKLEDGKS